MNQINDYDIVTNISLIWDPEQKKKYIEIDSKYDEYCESLLKDYDMKHLRNLIETISNKNISDLK